MASRGFRAVLIYPRVGGEMKVDLPEFDPVFAKVSELGLPLFLHGSGNAKDPTLQRLEDGGAGVSYAVLSDASVNECVMRMIAGGVFGPPIRISTWSSGAAAAASPCWSRGCPGSTGGRTATSATPTSSSSTSSSTPPA